MRAYLLVCVVVAAATVGCLRHDVQVRDASGRPVEGVEVAAAMLTVTGPTAETNAAGWARVEHHPLRKPYWLRVRSPGGPWRDMTWPTRWPVRLVLHEGVLWDPTKD